MKKNRLIAFMMAVVCVVLLVIPAFAAEARASVQLASYAMNVTASPGTLNVFFSVTGNGIMNKIGCESIHVFEKSDSHWVPAENWDENDDGMSRTNYHAHANTIYCNGEAGVEYLVMVAIYAENNDGRDVRQQNFYIVGQ